MARIRGLKPGFFKDEDLACLPFGARLLFLGLVCEADREGRLEYRPKRLKVEIMPFDDVDIPSLCGILVDPKIPHRPEKRFISIYEVEGQQYIQVLLFKKHQNPHHKEKPSKIPPMPGFLDNPLINNKTCETPSIDATEQGKDGVDLPVPCSLFLVSGSGSGERPSSKPQVQNDLHNDDASPPELTCIASHAWETFRTVWTPALSNGKFIDEDACREKWARTSAMWNQWIAAEKNYVVSRRVREGYPMNPMKFLSGAWRDWQTPETPLGSAAVEPDFSWRADRDQDEAQFAEEQLRMKSAGDDYRPRDKLPFESDAEYEAKRLAGKLLMVPMGE